MKTIQELQNQTPVYLNNWHSKFDVMCDFEDIFLSESEFNSAVCPYANTQYWNGKKEAARKVLPNWEPIKILFASYGTDNYSGDAFVLFIKDGKLYEVDASHCSCYGLEGQWKPEETSLLAIEMRLTKGTMGVDNYSGNEFANELKNFIGI